MLKSKKLKLKANTDKMTKQTNKLRKQFNSLSSLYSRLNYAQLKKWKFKKQKRLLSIIHWVYKGKYILVFGLWSKWDQDEKIPWRFNWSKIVMMMVNLLKMWVLSIPLTAVFYGPCMNNERKHHFNWMYLQAHDPFDFI